MLTLKGAGSSASSPISTDSLIGWWDVSRETGFANNAAISQLTDWSGNGKTMTATGSPVYKTNQQNGLPGVEFNGSNNFMQADIANSTLTLVVVGRFISFTTLNTRFFGLGQEFSIYGNSPGVVGFYKNNPGDAITIFPTGATDTKIYVFRFQNGTAHFPRCNGVNGSQSINPAGPVSGAKLALGANGNLAPMFEHGNTMHHEIICYSRIVSDAECPTAFESYLSGKWVAP